jgi:hypothetical protein
MYISHTLRETAHILTVIFHNLQRVTIPNFKILPLFTTEEKAKQEGSERIPKRFKCQELGQRRLVKLLQQVALPRGIKLGIFDPNLSA